MAAVCGSRLCLLDGNSYFVRLQDWRFGYLQLTCLCFVSVSRMVVGQENMLHIVDVGHSGRIRSLDAGEGMVFRHLACPPQGAFIMAVCWDSGDDNDGRICTVDPGPTPAMEIVREEYVGGFFNYA